MKVLCIDDNIALVTQLVLALKKHGIDAEHCESFENIDEAVLKADYDVILLDINLPFEDGFYWCRKIREATHTPIIFISSRDEKLDKIMGLTLGGDDYITKPIDIDLLVVKLNSIVRRVNNYQNDADNKTVIQYNDLTLHVLKYELQFNNQQIELTKNETKILTILLRKQGDFVNREVIMQYLWDHESYIDDNTLNVNMSRLRKKLFDLCQHEKIETKRQVGYRII